VLLLRMILCAAAAALPLLGAAQERKATPSEAVAMVKRAVAAIHKDGAARAYPAISDRKGSFVVRDLYIAVYGLDGTVRAHGGNANMIGKNLIGLRDIDGRPFVRERVELARSHDSFWHEYQFTHPETKKIEPKRMYCEKLQDSVVCGGVYK
jgi:cytochrome c